MWQVSSEMKHDVRLGLTCLPVMIMISVVGFLTGHVPAASIAAGGAMTLSFGANKTWGGSSFVMLLITTLGLMLSAWIGTLAGNSVPLYIAGAMLYTGLYVMMANIDSSAWWMLQQWAIAYLIAGYFSDGPLHDAERAALIGLGAALQMLFLAKVYDHTRFRLKALNPHRWFSFLEKNTAGYRKKLHLQWSVMTGIVGMSVVLCAARFLDMPNGYWAGMTLLLCLRNHYHDSLGRARSRVIGTLLGGIFAALLLNLLSTQWFIVSAFIVCGFISFTLSYSFIQKSYLIYSIVMTMTVVFMISAFTGSERGVALHRIESTALGGAVAIAAFVITRWVTGRKIAPPHEQR